MASELTKLLKTHYVDGVHHTHVSMVGTKGRFQFNRQGMEELWETYTNIITNTPESHLGLAEKPQFYLPVLADIDIAVREDSVGNYGEKLYSEEQVENVIGVYQKVLKNIVEDCTDDDLTCVLLEKPMYRKNVGGVEFLKNGFHLHFPNIFLNRTSQDAHVIPMVKEILNNDQTFSDLGFENSGDVIDKACCSVPWLMYGSKKTESQQPYKISRIYNAELDTISMEEAFAQYQIYNHRERLIKISGNVEKYIPRILSIIPYGRKTKELRHGLISPLKKKMKEESGDKEYHTPISIAEGLKIANKILPMIADWRAEDRNEWLTIGWCLFNIGDGCREALDQWLEFSARCGDKFDESECVSIWDKMVKKGLTLGTLRYYASVDSPDEYAKFKKERALDKLETSLEGSHNDIAKALYETYGDEFVCASFTNKVWFQFIDHKWEMIEDGIFLRRKISGEIVEHFIERGTQLWEQASRCADSGEEAMYKARLKQIKKMVQSLKSATFKNNVMRECMEVFYDKRFRERLDTNPYLFAFKNGVMDLKTNVFRPGRPEDFISKCAPINYLDFSLGDPKIQEIHTFLEQIFPDKELRAYFLDTVSDVFIGGNHQKTVVFWTGDGDNGKSVVQTMIEQMLGPLAIKFNTTVVTGKKPMTGAANADLARAGGGVRWAVLEEPDGDEMINTGTLKHLSGNDSFYARDLFERGKDGREVVPMFKLIFICNKLPKLKYSDPATWNRVRVLPFETKFCRESEPAPETYEEQIRQKRFPMDKQFGKKIPSMLEPLAWVLLDHQKNLKVRVEPEKVRMATSIYKKQNDIYRQFIDECIAEDSTKSLPLTVLYSRFKEWHRESLPHHPLPIKNEVEEYFSRAWGHCEEGKKWRGYRMRTVDEEVEDGTAIVLSEDDLVDYEKIDKDNVGRSGLPPM